MGSAAPANGVAEELWRHANPQSTPMWRFLEQVNKNQNLNLASYQDLYKWSVDDISQFWHETWQFVGIKASKPYDKVSHSYSATAAGLALN